MPPKTKSPEMSLAVALFFTLGSGTALVAFLWVWIVPAAWVQFTYSPVEATVIETRLGSRGGVKGGRHYYLEALLAYEVEGQEYRGWVELPLIAYEKTGPKAEAVLGQLQDGQTVTAFYDPLRPAAGLVLDRDCLEWRMIPGLLCPSLVLLFGVGCVIGSWRRTFPRGVAAETADLLGRLPRRFYLAAAGLAACAAVALAGVAFLGPDLLGGWITLLVIGVAVAGAIVLFRRVVRYGAVAFVSPERRAAEQGAAPPAASASPPEPSLSSWNRAEPIRVDPGQHLRVRLQMNWFSATPVVALYIILGGGLAGVIILGKLAQPWLTGLAPSAQTAVRAAGFALVLGGVVLLGWRLLRRLRALAVEVSRHPLHTGAGYRLRAAHPDAKALARLRMELVCEERTFEGKSTRTAVPYRRLVAFDESAEGGTARAGHLDIPAGLPPTFKLDHHEVRWGLVASIGRWFRWKVSFPLWIESAAAAEAPSGPPETERLDDGPVSIWISDSVPAFAPGAHLRGGYAIRPRDGSALRTAELSVLWYTGPPGAVELGVCHYREHRAVEENDLPLCDTRRFEARLPDGPPSYDGKAVAIRWAVRLRLRYADGEELVRELQFRLGALRAP